MKNNNRNQFNKGYVKCVYASEVTKSFTVGKEYKCSFLHDIVLINEDDHSTLELAPKVSWKAENNTDMMMYYEHNIIQVRSSSGGVSAKFIIN